VLDRAVVAAVAAQAALNVVSMAFDDFFSKIGIGKQLAAKDHEIDDTVGNELFAHVRAVDATDDADTDVGRRALFDDRRHLDVTAMFTVKGRELQRPVGLVIMAGRNVQDVDQAAEHFAEFGAVLGGCTALDPVGPADPQFDNEIFTNLLTDPAQDFQRKTGAIREAGSAVSVGAAVF
jgi:hypothetical protein